MTVSYNSKAKRCRDGKKFVACPPSLAPAKRAKPKLPKPGQYPVCDRPAFERGPRGGKFSIVNKQSNGKTVRICKTTKGVYYIKDNQNRVQMISKTEYAKIVAMLRRLRAARFKKPKGILAGLGLPVPLQAASMPAAITEAAAVVPVRLPALDSARARAVANDETFSLLPSVPVLGSLGPAQGKQQNLLVKPSAGISLTPNRGPIAALSKAIEVPIARTLEALEAPTRNR